MPKKQDYKHEYQAVRRMWPKGSVGGDTFYWYPQSKIEKGTEGLCFADLFGGKICGNCQCFDGGSPDDQYEECVEGRLKNITHKTDACNHYEQRVEVDEA